MNFGKGFLMCDRGEVYPSDSIFYEYCRIVSVRKANPKDNMLGRGYNIYIQMGNSFYTNQG